MFSAITISLRIANWLNWFFGALLMVTLSAIVGDWAGLGTMVFTHIEPASTHNAIRGYLFAMVVMMPPVMVAVHWILTRLAALVRDAAVGHALTDANAARLRAIAWATLAIAIVDLCFGWVSVATSKATGEYFGWSLSLTGWIAVPLLFVLAHIFREGAAMRADLEGTV